MISVLLQSRANLFSKPGGDTIQITNLREDLIRKGLNVDISTELKPCVDAYDIVHLFNITRVHETYVQMVNAKRQGKPVVCTAIYHDLEEYNRKGRYGLGKIAFKLTRNDDRFEYVRGLFNALRDRNQIVPVMKQWKLGYRAQQEAILIHADKIIFGSRSETEMVLARFEKVSGRISHETIMVESPFSSQDADPIPFQKKFGLKDFILCVGRIEDLKNQLGLILAMKGEDIPLVLIGGLNAAHRGYGKKVLREVEKKDNLHYLGPMEKPMLMSAFASAKVHVLPSWFETTGLTSLEAGLAGCNVVSTNRGYARDYLEGYAWYCDPADPVSLREIVLGVYFLPRRKDLAMHIRKKLRMEKCIYQTIAVYDMVLSKS